MKSSHNRIIPLNIKSQRQLHSATRVSTLNEVITSLIENSLDANARSIRVDLDYIAGSCTVVDDGVGIASEEFEEDGLLAQPQCSYKEASTNVRGRYGTFLSNLASVYLLCITSRAYNDRANSMWLNSSGRLSTHHEVPGDETFPRGHGTEVVVLGFLKDLPVRLKHNTDLLGTVNGVVREFNCLKHAVVGLILSSERTFDIACLTKLHHYDMCSEGQTETPPSRT